MTLDPCPFCRGAAGMETQNGDERESYADTVTCYCTSCGASIKRRGDSSKRGYADNSRVHAETAAAWNRRAPLDN